MNYNRFYHPARIEAGGMDFITSCVIYDIILCRPPPPPTPSGELVSKGNFGLGPLTGTACIVCDDEWIHRDFRVL